MSLHRLVFLWLITQLPSLTHVQILTSVLAVLFILELEELLPLDTDELLGQIPSDPPQHLALDFWLVYKNGHVGDLLWTF